MGHKGSKKHVSQLLDNNYLAYTIPENPKDRNQKYQLTSIGKSLLKD
jgi:ATP-dependent DNA helicase RecG